jgi:hypothetical protein
MVHLPQTEGFQVAVYSYVALGTKHATVFKKVTGHVDAYLARGIGQVMVHECPEKDLAGITGCVFARDRDAAVSGYL